MKKGTHMEPTRHGIDCTDEGCPWRGEPHWHEVDGDTVAVPCRPPTTMVYTDHLEARRPVTFYPVHLWYGVCELHGECWRLQVYDMDLRELRDLVLDRLERLE